VRLGVRTVTVQKGMARLGGLELRASQQARLRRLAPGSVVKAEEVVIPVAVSGAETAAALVGLLEELAPREDAVPATV
jgi:hypothetical protein